ncbi:MAG TPA: hypothetical protein VD994_18220 [Prosthecobacter sp.]|nr:hypothetical protein [Prosthecobacter sp.]
MRSFLLLAFATLAAAHAAEAPPPAPPVSKLYEHEELRRFKSPEANQGVVADDEFLYVISNSAIGKYRKTNGEQIAAWKQPKGGPLIHLNAGMMHEGKLYCAHSDFSQIPMTSSVEIFDPATLKHISTHSLGIGPGSLTWIAWHQQSWFACFAHYSKDKPKTGRDPSWTELVQFDPQWRRMAGWVFPASILERFGGSSCSGGTFGRNGEIYVTGHTWAELYVLRFPEAGSTLVHVDTIPISAEGQAFCWDPVEPDIFYGIIKRTQEVVVSRIKGTSAHPAQPQQRTQSQ